ncbi:MAG: peptidoglycan binding domain-containing protein [Chloroflexi bacterium]|nr:peptidoglycan binding domain-containing protein [Chloroflexota bacterium]
MTLKDPALGQQWTKTPAELGIAYDLEQTVETAYNVGRSGGPVTQFKEMFNSWYYGKTLPAIIVFDESRLDSAIAELSTAVEQPAIDATFIADGVNASYTPSQVGRQLNKADFAPGS